jgi:hypothetical protein
MSLPEQLPPFWRFQDFALDQRFGAYPCDPKFPCPQPQILRPVVVDLSVVDPKGLTGMATNNRILDYQFLFTQDFSYCGRIGGQQDCAACPCEVTPNMKSPPSCDYGYNRNVDSITGPSAGNRMMPRWG